MKILARDPFGARVAQYYIRLDCAAQLLAGSSSDLDQLKGSTLLWAASRTYQNELTQLSSRAVELGLTWCPVFVNRGVLQVGPVYVSGQPGCYSCYARRHLSKQGLYGLSLAKKAADAYRDHAAVEPSSSLKPVAVIASQLAFDLLRSESEAPGQMRFFDLLSGQFSSGRVIAIHGCECRLDASVQNPQDRFWKRLPVLEMQASGDI